MAEKRTIADTIDDLMEQASAALVRREYFQCEAMCVDALAKAIPAREYERAARVVNPLQEARRQKRLLACDTGRLIVLTEPLGEFFKPESAVYLLVPPRVAQEARTLRAIADHAHIPVVVVTREPRTSSGQCPIVTVGPVTVRAYTTEPGPAKPAAPAANNKAKKPAKVKADGAEPIVNGFGTFQRPDLAWVLAASETLGDAAIAEVNAATPFARVDELHLRLQSHPDHEKLHQRLREACEEAARELLINPDALKRSAPPVEEDEPLEAP